MFKPVISFWLLTVSLCTFWGCDQERNTSRFTLQELNSPAAAMSEEPNLFVGGDGRMYLNWVEIDTTGHAELKFSVYEKGVWQAPRQIAEGNDWFVNWADYPAMAVDAKGNMVASYLAKSSPATYAYGVWVTASHDGGKTWSDAIKLHDDTTHTEHGFVSMIAQPDSGFLAIWLDGRQTAAKGPMNVRAAFLSPNLTKTGETVLDDRVCDCCQTTVAWTKAGPVALFRDRSETELRDMAIARFEQGRWSSSRIIHNDNWTINGCPVNGPRSDALDSLLAVAWFTMADGKAAVKCIASRDAGKTFGAPILLAEGQIMGRVDIVLLDADHAVGSWMEMAEEKALIKAAKIDLNTFSVDEMAISSTSSLRDSGFPQICLWQSELYFAWTDVSEGLQVRFATLKNFSTQF